MQNTHMHDYILEPLKVCGALLETTHLFYRDPACKPTFLLFSRPLHGTIVIVRIEVQFEHGIN